MKEKVKKFLSNPAREEGQGLVEYALILVLVAVVVIVILSALGPAIGNIFSQVNAALGGDIAAVDDSSGCIQAYANHYVVVNPGGAVPQGNLQWPDSTCSGPSNNGGITFDSVYIPGGGDVTSATAQCTASFGKVLRFPNDPSSQIWPGSGFWYCTP